jgi:sugar phosphate isomerase/epimerase
MPVIQRDRLGVQLHCLRHQLARDPREVLARLARMQLTSIELCHFPGFAGNPWGDFGELANWSPGRIETLVRDEGCTVVSTHFTFEDLAADKLDDSIGWSLDIGSPSIILAGVPRPDGADIGWWRSRFGWLNETGRKINAAGLSFAYHTQNDVWQVMDGALLANEMFRVVNPNCCSIELDPSGALAYRSDWAEPVLQHPNRYFAFHLRDGRVPEQAVPYLPAVPLGKGDIDIRRAVEVARKAGIGLYLLEMEVENPDTAFDALEESVHYLDSQGLIA